MNTFSFDLVAITGKCCPCGDKDCRPFVMASEQKSDNGSVQYILVVDAHKQYKAASVRLGSLEVIYNPNYKAILMDKMKSSIYKLLEETIPSEQVKENWFENP